MRRNEIGRRVERLRTRMGLSTQQLADRIGKSQATISRIENGKQGVSIELLTQISRALRIHPFGLLTDAPLRHSVLLPPTAAVRSDSPMRMFARCLNSARVRAKLDLEEAAESLGMEADELEAVEFGYALPDPEVLQRMAELYPVDGRILSGLAMLERECPALSERMAMLEHLLTQTRQYLASAEHSPESDARLAAEINSCLGEEAQAAERQASYFSIGHLSDDLLRALQDPEFHEWVEQMAGDWVKRQALREEARRIAEKERASAALGRDGSSGA